MMIRETEEAHYFLGGGRDSGIDATLSSSVAHRVVESEAKSKPKIKD